MIYEAQFSSLQVLSSKNSANITFVSPSLLFEELIFCCERHKAGLLLFIMSSVLCSVSVLLNVCLQRLN